MLPETKRQIARIFKLCLDHDLRVVLKLNRQSGGLELRGVKADGELSDLLNKLAFVKQEVSFLNGDHVEDFFDFFSEFFSDLVILSPEVESATGVADVKHPFVFKLERADQVQVLPASDANVDFGFLPGC